MAITAETRTGIIALSVAMLGEAPGTARLGEWVEAVDGGMSLEDLANHIAASDAFQATYPNFSTNDEFASAFLGNVLGGNVSATLMSAAVGIVTGLLNDGMTRGALALAVVGALHDISAAGADHPAYGDLGAAAMAFANKVEVASHYTLEARMADPSSDALEGVTADADSVAMAIEAIGAGSGDDAAGQNFVLTTVRDDIDGTSGDDLIVAEPVQQVSNVFQDTLNPFDDIDGGDGNDTIAIYGVEPSVTLSLGAEQVRNVENAILSTVGAINADMSSWEGLESVDLQRFGSGSDVSITVDGAMVSTDMTFGGDVTLVGAAGDVSIKAGGTSNVHIGSAGHTGTVMVTGGGNITVGKNADGGGQSMTVTSVSVDGVARAAGTTTGATEADTSEVREADITHNDDGSAQTGGVVYVLPPTDATATAFVSVTAVQAALNTYYIAKDQGNIVKGQVDEGSDPAESDDVVLTANQIRVTTDITMAEGYVAGTPGTPSGGGPTLTVNSDAITDLQLHNTQATVLVHNNSKTADNKNMPEDLAVTVNKYGNKDVDGKLCIAGAGSAENIMLTVAGDSWVDLNSNAVKMLDVTANAKLDLGVRKFNAQGVPDGASGTLESVTISGAGAVTMGNLNGLAKLAGIDASASSADNSFKSSAQLAALATVMGGSGNDKIELVTTAGGKLASVYGGDGGDTVKVTGAHRTAGLMVDLGAGDDTYEGDSGGDKNSRVDGGNGMDTLKLSATPATYGTGANKASIYSNFEILDVGGGTGTYDVAMLGVDTVVARGGTGEEVTLSNMADGMGITVHGAKGTATTATTATTANIVHDMKDRESGDARYSGELDVNLLAIGGDMDTKDGTSGGVTLTLAVDPEIEALTVDSSASVGGSKTNPASNRPGAANYQNVLDTAGSATIEDIFVSGNAMLTVSGDALGALDLIDASDNTGGVTFNGASLTQALELIGGGGVDMLTGGGTADEIMGGGGNDTLNGGAGADEITGGAGGDTLTGGRENDMFKYSSASESQIVFSDKGPSGFDTIVDFAPGADTISLSETVYNGLYRADTVANVIRKVTETQVINSTDAATDETANSLEAWLGDGKNVFKTSGGSGLSTSSTQHAITTVNDTYWTTAPELDDDGNVTTAGVPATRTWVLIDVDADGDFDAATDMVILLSGGTGGTAFDLTVGGGDFTP